MLSRQCNIWESYYIIARIYYPMINILRSCIVWRECTSLATMQYSGMVQQHCHIEVLAEGTMIPQHCVFGENTTYSAVFGDSISSTRYDNALICYQWVTKHYRDNTSVAANRCLRSMLCNVLQWYVKLCAVTLYHVLVCKVL